MAMCFAAAVLSVVESLIRTVREVLADDAGLDLKICLWGLRRRFAIGRM